MGSYIAPDFKRQRQRMVNEQLLNRGISDPAVLDAMSRTQRHLFVPEALQPRAYDDHPLPIGHGQTISQPYIVACMTQLLEASPGMSVLEVGTGSGYQSAILAGMGLDVFTVERVRELYSLQRICSGVWGCSASVPELPMERWAGRKTRLLIASSSLQGGLISHPPFLTSWLTLGLWSSPWGKIDASNALCAFSRKTAA